MNFPDIIQIHVVGDAKAGKTSLVDMYIGNTFNEEHISTIGVSSKSKDIERENKEYKIFFTDYGGEERFNSPVKDLYNKADLIIAVYDVNNEKSFENLKNKIRYIIANNKKIKNGHFIIIGSKADIKSEDRIPIEEVSSWVEEENFSGLYEVSAKEDRVYEGSDLESQPINVLFSKIINQVIKNKEEQKKPVEEKKQNPEMQAYQAKFWQKKWFAITSLAAATFLIMAISFAITFTLQGFDFGNFDVAKFMLATVVPTAAIILPYLLYNFLKGKYFSTPYNPSDNKQSKLFEFIFSISGLGIALTAAAAFLLMAFAFNEIELAAGIINKVNGVAGLYDSLIITPFVSMMSVLLFAAFVKLPAMLADKLSNKTDDFSEIGETDNKGGIEELGEEKGFFSVFNGAWDSFKETVAPYSCGLFSSNRPVL